MGTVAVLLFFVAILTTSEGNFPDFGNIETLADDLDTTLNQRLVDASGLNKLQMKYGAQASSFLRDVNGAELVNDLAKNLKRVLDTKVEALKEAVRHAEKITKGYKWKSNLELNEEFEKDYFLRAKEINDSDEAYKFSDEFNQNVNFNSSSVHIPVEIYEGSVDILNGLVWTRDLEAVWKSNKEKHPELLWQYFGSQNGIMRNYPATRWRGDEPDLYDVRRRPWYTQGASSPKDMFILVDTSGSTHGQALALMKHSVNSLLDTLGENDFVNVGHFAGEANLVACFDTFVQANYWNKQVLKRMIETNLTAKGMAKYEIGFKFAFEQFEKLDNETAETNGSSDDLGQCARCNRIIMFLTDGGTDQPENIFKEYNWDKGNKTRVFSYAVGPTASPFAAVRWAACSNRGYFYKIPAMGAIRSAVQDYTNIVAKPKALSKSTSAITWSNLYSDQFAYLSVLARPLAIAGQDQLSWTNVHLDQWGLGMMTTVTMPVYNRTEEKNNQNILGVMGSDVTVSELEKYIPRRQLGPNGYAFAINSNGYIVFHPNLKSVNGFLKEPPNVDILDVEFSNPEKEELRRRMIDQENNGVSKIHGFVMVPDEQHIDNQSRVYYYTSIEGTTFSVAIVIPEYNEKYLNLSDGTVPVSEGVLALEDGDSVVMFSPWDYCQNISAVSNESTLEEDLVAAILSDPNYENCNKEMVQRLFFDANITKSMESEWAETVLSDQETSPQAAFVATESGLLRIFPSSIENGNETIELRESFEPLTDLWNEVYYKRSFDNSDKWMYCTTHNADSMLEPNASAPLVIATKVLTAGAGFYPGVIGLQLSQDYLRSVMKQRAELCYNEDVMCFLLDDAGFLIVSTETEHDMQIGLPFEDVEPILMNYLIGHEVLVKNEQFDYQGACVPQEDPKVSAGFRSVVPHGVFELLSLQWWSSKVAWAYINFNIYNWLTSLYSQTNGVMATEEDPTETPQNYSCIMHLAQYYRNPDTEISNHKDMDLCGRHVATVKFVLNNLILVMAKKDSEGLCDENNLATVTREPEETSEDPNFADDMCNVTRRYRRRPEGCYDYNEHEDNQCGAASVIYHSLLVLVSVTLALGISGSLTSS